MLAAATGLLFTGSLELRCDVDDDSAVQCGMSEQRAVRRIEAEQRFDEEMSAKAV